MLCTAPVVKLFKTPWGDLKLVPLGIRSLNNYGYSVYQAIKTLLTPYNLLSWMAATSFKFTHPDSVITKKITPWPVRAVHRRDGPNPMWETIRANATAMP